MTTEQEFIGQIISALVSIQTSEHNCKHESNDMHKCEVPACRRVSRLLFAWNCEEAKTTQITREQTIPARELIKQLGELDFPYFGEDKEVDYQPWLVDKDELKKASAIIGQLDKLFNITR